MVWRRKRKVSNGECETLRGSSEDVLDITRSKGIDCNEQRFQQDRATHTHQITPFDWLRERFRKRLTKSVTSSGHFIHRTSPPHSPDLKDNVYQNNPQTIAELNGAIATKIRLVQRMQVYLPTPRSFRTYSRENIPFVRIYSTWSKTRLIENVFTLTSALILTLTLALTLTLILILKRN